MILAIKTNDSTTEIYLLDVNSKVVSKKVWQSERRLAQDLLDEIDKLINKKWRDLTGLIVFRGPGSFTGLRIGITTMNTIAYSLSLPIVGADGANWLDDGLKRLDNNENDRITLPEYGQAPNISKPKK